MKIVIDMMGGDNSLNTTIPATKEFLNLYKDLELFLIGDLDILTKECGYVAPESLNKGLHTSCQIEKCKEYSQFIRFYKMESTMIHPIHIVL